MKIILKRVPLAWLSRFSPVLALLVIQHTLLTFAEWASEVVGEHRVVYSDNGGTMNHSQASDFCESEFGTSLGSFHSRDEFSVVRDVLLQYAATQVGTGVRCADKTMRFDNDTEFSQPLLWYENTDSTQVDHLFAGCLWSTFDYKECQTDHWIYLDMLDRLQNNCKVQSKDISETVPMFICNTQSDSEWQSRNPRTDGELECERGECLLNCTERTICTNREFNVTDQHSFVVDCVTGPWQCASLFLRVSQVSNVTILCRGLTTCVSLMLIGERINDFTLIADKETRAADQCLIHLRESKHVQIVCNEWHACSSSKQFIYDSQYIDLYYEDNHGSNYDNGVRINNATSVTVECDHCAGTWIYISNVTELINVTVDDDDDKFEESLWFIQDNMGDVLVDCILCPQSLWNFTNVNYLWFRCKDHDSCGFLDSSQETTTQKKITLDNVTKLDLVCMGSDSCPSRLFGISNTWDISDIEELNVECQATGACFCNDGAVSVFSSNDDDNVVSRMSTFNLSCYDEDSCCLTMPWEMRRTNVVKSRRESSILNLKCLGPLSCASDQVRSLMEGSIRTLVSNVRVSCLGLLACQGLSINSVSQSGSITVICDNQSRRSNQGSCVDILVNGYCARSVNVYVRGNEQSQGLSLICPESFNNENQGGCNLKITKQATVKELEIGMTDREWSANDYLISAKSRSIKQASTVHFSESIADSKCSELSMSDGDLGCFLENIRGKLWRESSVCSDFTMNAYSPATMSVVSGTLFSAALFALMAMNQGRQKKKNDDDMNVDIRMINALFLCVSLLSFTANVISQLLIGYESDVNQNIGTDQVAKLSHSFPIWVGLNVISLAALMNVMHVWIAFQDCWMISQSYSILIYVKNKLMNDWHSNIIISYHESSSFLLSGMMILLIVFRSFQMIIVYIVVSVLFYDDSDSDDSDGSHNLSSFITVFCLTIGMDVLIMIPSSMMAAPLCGCLMFLLTSSLSPMSLSNTLLSSSKSFYEVIASDNGEEQTLLWFDLAYFEMVVSFVAMMIVVENHHLRWKLWGLFVALLDLATDLTVVIYWLNSELYLWAFLQMSFTIISSLIQWLQIRTLLNQSNNSIFGHCLTLCGLARALCKTKVWSENNDERGNNDDGLRSEWMMAEQIVSQTESFYESYPSLLFAMYLIISENWRAHLSGDLVFASMGPLFISVFITALGLASKGIDHSSSLFIINHNNNNCAFNKRIIQLCFLIFIICDFIVHGSTLVLCFTLAQGSNHNSTASMTLIVTFFSIMIVLSLWNFIIARYYCMNLDSYHYSLSSMNQTALLLFSVPCVMTSMPLLLSSVFNHNGRRKKRRKSVILVVDLHDDSPSMDFLKVVRSCLLTNGIFLFAFCCCLSIEPEVFSHLMIHVVLFFTCWIISSGFLIVLLFRISPIMK